MTTNSIHEFAETELAAITNKIKDGLRRGKFTAQELQEAVMEKSKHVARTTDYYVHENPWTAVAVGAGAGIALGLLVSSCACSGGNGEAKKKAAPAPAKKPDSHASPLHLLQSTLLFAVSAAKAVQAFRAIR